MENISSIYCRRSKTNTGCLFVEMSMKKGDSGEGAAFLFFVTLIENLDKGHRRCRPRPGRGGGRREGDPKDRPEHLHVGMETGVGG